MSKKEGSYAATFFWGVTGFTLLFVNPFIGIAVIVLAFWCAMQKA